MGQSSILLNPEYLWQNCMNIDMHYPIQIKLIQFNRIYNGDQKVPTLFSQRATRVWDLLIGIYLTIIQLGDI